MGAVFALEMLMRSCSSANKGVFKPALFSSVESNPGVFTPLVQFVWEGVNTSITLGCGPKQPDRDLVEEVVSVWFQTNSGTVRL